MTVRHVRFFLAFASQRLTGPATEEREFARTFDPDHRLPEGAGYSSLFEFYLGDDAGVDARYAELVAAGYHGRMAPAQTQGPYAAMVDDPDGRVILLTSDEAGLG